MEKLSDRQKRTLERIGIIILALLCIGSIVWFGEGFKQDYDAGDFRPMDIERHEQQKELGSGSTAAVSVPSIPVSSIQTWMTFDYLNVAFKLPATYLQSALAITDPRYPNIRIDRYTQRHQINETTFFTGLQTAITNYTLTKK